MEVKFTMFANSKDKTRRSINSPEKLVDSLIEDTSVTTLYDLLKRYFQTAIGTNVRTCTKHSQRNCMGERPILKVHEEEKMEKQVIREILY